MPRTDTVVKAVAGMLNSEGGRVFIGVADDGTVIGLEEDYKTLGKQSRDGFAVTLSNLLEARLGVNALPLIRIDFESIDGRDVCVVSVDPSTLPIYVREGDEEQFYVRTQSSTRPLNLSEAKQYMDRRFQ